MQSRVDIILWLAMLWSVALYYVVMRVVPAPEPSENPTLVTALTAVACGVVAVSLLVKNRLFARGLRLPGLIVALGLCEAAALLGLVTWFITGSPRAWVPLVVGAAGILLHYPTRED